MSMHRNINRRFALFTILMLILVTPACGEATPEASSTPEPTATLEPTEGPEPQYKILFIGSSLTYYNRGLKYHFTQLVGAADPQLVIQADAVTRSGAPLEHMWEQTDARERIGEGNYDVVVLQDAIPNTDVDTFHEYVRLFVEEIRDAGAEPVLFLTWARMGHTTDEIAQAHGDIAMELGVDVAPVGLAWQRAMEERPELDLYMPDDIHPSIHGTYLTVNVIYAAVFGEIPIGLDYLPSDMGGVTEAEAAFLQRIAWETVQEYQTQ
ncbi:MAG: SGNH/GDSL hydrolase family protein [Anaerolineales bacterium]|jgi:hypothetical protein